MSAFLTPMSSLINSQQSTSLHGPSDELLANLSAFSGSVELFQRRRQVRLERFIPIPFAYCLNYCSKVCTFVNLIVRINLSKLFCFEPTVRFCKASLSDQDCERGFDFACLVANDQSDGVQ